MRYASSRRRPREGLAFGVEPARLRLELPRRHQVETARLLTRRENRRGAAELAREPLSGVERLGVRGADGGREARDHRDRSGKPAQGRTPGGTAARHGERGTGHDVEGSDGHSHSVQWTRQGDSISVIGQIRPGQQAPRRSRVDGGNEITNPLSWFVLQVRLGDRRVRCRLVASIIDRPPPRFEDPSPSPRRTRADRYPPRPRPPAISVLESSDHGSILG